jgi:hypothetical protein
MKNITLTLLTLLFSGAVVAQPMVIVHIPRPMQNINLNYLGDASVLSLNYERIFTIKKYLSIAGQAGVGYDEEFKLCIWGNCTPPKKYLTLPHHVTGIFGKKKHFLEFGIGGTAMLGKENKYYVFYPILGYRIQPIRPKKVNFRVYGSWPLNTLSNEDLLFVPFGLSLGYCF